MPAQHRTYALLAAMAGWLSITVHFFLFRRIYGGPASETLIRFFSFFTILSNISFSLCFTFFFLKGAGHRFFTSPQLLTAITVYMLVVGIIYNAVLRNLWAPQGLLRITDEMLHVLNPLLMLFFWILYVSKQNLRWKDVWSWLLFPLAYSALIGMRGAISGFYPYPFLNVTQLGYPKVVMNGIVLLVVFLFLSLVLTGLAKLSSRK